MFIEDHDCDCFFEIYELTLYMGLLTDYCLIRLVGRIFNILRTSSLYVGYQMWQLNLWWKGPFPFLLLDNSC